MHEWRLLPQQRHEQLCLEDDYCLPKRQKQNEILVHLSQRHILQILVPQAQTLLQFQLQLNHQGEFHQVMEQCLAVAQLDRPN